MKIMGMPKDWFCNAHKKTNTLIKGLVQNNGIQNVKYLCNNYRNSSLIGMAKLSIRNDIHSMLHNSDGTN